MGRPTVRRPVRPRRTHRDRGMATVEVVGYMILVIGLLFLGVQMVMWGAAGYGARLAADRAAQAARVYGSTAEAGQAEAELMLTSVVGSKLRDAQVTVTRTATTVTVRITGHAQQVIPGFDPPVSVTVSVPVERTTT
jgi:hypothetical protein